MIEVRLYARILQITKADTETEWVAADLRVHLANEEGWLKSQKNRSSIETLRYLVREGVMSGLLDLGIASLRSLDDGIV